MHAPGHRMSNLDCPLPKSMFYGPCSKKSKFTVKYKITNNDSLCMMCDHKTCYLGLGDSARLLLLIVCLVFRYFIWPEIS